MVVVDPRDSVYVSLNSHSVEGTLENVKSDFTINMAEPIELTRGIPWDVSLSHMTFSSALVNYNGSYAHSGPEGGRGVSVGGEEEEETAGDAAAPPKKKKNPGPLKVDCVYALLAVDGDGRWRKETPSPLGRPLKITFRDPTDKAAVAADINSALMKEVERVTFPPVPNPHEHDATYIRFYRKSDVSGPYIRHDQHVDREACAPVALEPLLNRCADVPSFLGLMSQYCVRASLSAKCRMYIRGDGRVVHECAHGDFTIFGKHEENLQRMLGVFGGLKSSHFLDTVQHDAADDEDKRNNRWVSPCPTSPEKPESDTPTDPYNLQAPYTWWSKGEANESISEDGTEVVKVSAAFGDSPAKHEVKFYTYRQIRECTSLESLYDLLLPRAIHCEVMGDGRLKMTSRDSRPVSVRITGMPCDIIPRAFGHNDPWRNDGGPGPRMRISIIIGPNTSTPGYVIMPVPVSFTPMVEMPVGQIVAASADKTRNAVNFQMTYSHHVQGFSILFDYNTPFYDFSSVSIGQVTADSYVPPRGWPTSLVHPASIRRRRDASRTDGPGKDRGDDGHLDAVTHHPDPDSIRALEPYVLKGLLPYAPFATLNLRHSLERNVPFSGYRMRVVAKRRMPRGQWTGTWTKTTAYAMSDIVGDLPFPASYQTSDALIAALYTSMNHAIADDVNNRQHCIRAEDLLKVIYDKSTRKYIFECGKDAARVSVSMRQPMARLFGMENEDGGDGEADAAAVKGPPIAAFAFAQGELYERHLDDGGKSSPEDHVWAREGHPLVKSPWLSPDRTRLPVAVRSRYPVLPSLGTENLFIKCDLIDGGTIHDGKRSGLLATVPVDWSEEATSVHQPAWQQALRVNKTTIRSIRIQIHDAQGERIKFMSNDNTPVIVNLRLTRRGNGRE